MEIIEINLVQLAREKININEYLTILKIAKNINDGDLPFSSGQQHLDSLEAKGWITQNENDVFLTDKSNKFVTVKSHKTNREHFDELFELYPYRTPGGRVLRSRNKTISNKVTRSYMINRDRYLKKITTTELHAQVLESVGRMISNAQIRNGMEYVQQLDTFINQSSWEKYINEEQAEDDNNKQNITRI